MGLTHRILILISFKPLRFSSCLKGKNCRKKATLSVFFARVRLNEVSMWIQIGLLTLAMAIWGLAFVAIKVALTDFTPFWMNGIRYLMAAFVLIPIFLINKTWQKSWKDLLKPFWASVFLLLGISLQTIGLKYTTVAKSSFITCLYVFLVPLYYSFWGKCIS